MSDESPSDTAQLKYRRNNDLRAEIVRAVGGDPSRYETAASARGLCKADLVRITETVTSYDEPSELTLRELYNTLDAAVSGMDHSHNAGNPWGIRREDLKALHRAVHDESQLVTDGGQSSDGTERNKGFLIYHIFADRGIESEVLEGFGRVVRVGLDPIAGYGEPVKSDARACPLQPGADLAVLHPPCTKWSEMTSIDGNPEDHPDLIETARELGAELADHWIIENVPKAPLDDPTVLNGRMFGLPIDYERAFETSFRIPEPPRYVRLDKQATSPYLYASHSKEWWAVAKGYNNQHPKQPIAKNCVPAAYLRYLLRWWLEALDRGQIRDYTKHETAFQEERERNDRRRTKNQSLTEFVARTDGGGR